MQPDETWLKKFCASIGISVKRSQELEAVRRSHCDVAAITSFFDKNSKMLDRDPHLIFNMDETMISSKRKFKVLIKNGKNLSSQHLPSFLMSQPVFALMQQDINSNLF